MSISSRRHFLGMLGAGGTATLIGDSILARLDRCNQEDDLPDLKALEGGRRVEQIEFVRERRVAVGEVTGEGLNGRLAFDLAEVSPEKMVTSNEEHFIRSRVPDGLDYEKRDPWAVRIHGLVDESVEIGIDELVELTEEKGTFVMECSGNSAGRAFGLLSAASWDGVAVADLLERVSIDSEATQILVSGFDDHSVEPGRGIEKNSSRGASWVFSFEDLKNTGAFLATRMNGQRLPIDHGFPVRLMVPGWYGCTCAKWVEEIKLVDDRFPTTSQMREFASRTHQTRAHKLAKDYAPAEMDLAAMPVRIERWEVDGKSVYQIVGIIWGGNTTTDKLMIKIGSSEACPVECYSHQQNQTWTIWRHSWCPEEAGLYKISMSIDDSEARTRRLDRGYYNRRVRI